jgi:D-xylose transport system ATP-binding protein
MVFDGRPVRVGSPAEAQQLGIATVFQDLALCDNLDVVANLYLGRELRSSLGKGRVLDEVEMERQSWELLRQLSAKIPSVRIPVASLSGGQRQTVAIARSLLGRPKVVMLDEPTAALGVAQTAEVLNLVERLRERGLAVILISHNMADVMAVADRVAVLRLGRNNGVFVVSETKTQDIIAAITGATDNAVSERAARRSREEGPAS